MVNVTIEQGILSGNSNITESGFEYFEFIQVPYAKPPLGDLRFKAPQPPEPWDGVRNATTFSEERICHQLDIISGSIKGTEDCLYLNVYTPSLPSTILSLLPVMVYFHHGSYNIGSGTDKSVSGPDYLIEHDVVVVTVNYRLGMFGFLNLNISAVPGNAGLKDQVMALKWVQNNIEKFGGDKNNVTLFGVSAGSSSIQYHIISPMSSGLFHKAISQSGSVLNSWASNYNIGDLVPKVCNELGYSGKYNDSNSIYEFLLEQTMESLMTATINQAYLAVIKGATFGFNPSIEIDFGNGEAFLTDYPYNLLKNGTLNKVNSLIGFTQFEAQYLKGAKPSLLTELGQSKNFTYYWMYSLDDYDMVYYNETFRNLYVTNNTDEVEFAINFLSDFELIEGTLTASEMLADRGIDVYEYMFSYDGELNALKKIIYPNITYEGAAHLDDTGYMFRYEAYNGIVIPERDILMRKKYTTMWTNFAKTGNPTPYTDELITITWPLFNTTTKHYLKLDEELTVLSDYKPNKTAMFQEIYNKYGK